MSESRPPAGQRALGGALLLGVAFGWGFNWPVMKIVLNEVPVWQFRAVTGAIAAGMLLALARLAGQHIRVPRSQWPALILAALFNITSWLVLIGYGLSLMASGHAAIISFTMPLWTALLGVAFLGEQMTLRRAVALVLGMGAVVTLLSHDFAALGASPLGAILTLIAAFNWAVGTHIQKQVAWQVGVLALAGWQMLIGIVPIAVIAAIHEPFVYDQASTQALLGSVYNVVIAFVFCYFCWFSVVRIFPAGIAAIGTLMVPIIGTVSAAIFLGEPFGWREITALALVVSGVGMVLITPSAPGGPTQKPRPWARRGAE